MMRPPPAGTASLLLLALLAGCADPATDPAPSPAEGPIGEAPDAAARPGPAKPEATVVSEPVAVDGTTGTTLCAGYTLPGTRCVLTRADVQPGLPLSRPVTAVYYSERVGSGLLPSTLTATWDAPTPATQTLRMEALVVRDCGETCEVLASLGEATGPSPLVLALPATPLGEGRLVGFTVSGTTAGQQVPESDVYVSQPFHVEGALAFTL